MGQQLNRPVKASWIADRLELSLRGADLEIEGVCPLNKPFHHGLTFSRGPLTQSIESALVVIGDPESTSLPSNSSLLVSKQPRMDFTLALELLEREIGFKASQTPPAIHPTARIGKNVVIGNGVVIGERTVVYHNVVIADDTRIGSHCVIKSGAVIGEEGFGFERAADGRPVRMPHLGNVIIHDHVEIGSLTTVCRGTMGSTILESHVKVDDHVHIAHNCLIRKNALVIACAEVSGGVEIGEGSWIAPNSSIIQKVKVGANCLVGLGAVVLKDVPDNTTVVGNPGKPLVKATRS